MTMPPRHRVPEAYEGRRIVVTGAAGFLGSRLVRRLSAVPCGIVRVLRPEAVAARVGGRAHITDLPGNIASEQFWRSCLAGSDCVFHFAGQTSAATASADPAADFEANVTPVLCLLEACASLEGAPAVVLAGTVTQAGIPSRLPVDETHADHPVTVYDRHKLAAERSLEQHAARGTARGTCLRLANVYGPGPQSRRQDRGILNRMIGSALRGEPPAVYGTGEYLRDYLYVDDAVDAFLAAGACIDRVSGRHFVVGSGRGYTVAQAAALVAQRAGRKTGHPIGVRHVEPPQGLDPIDARNFVADPGRFAAATGWAATVDLAEGIDRTLEALACAS